MNVTKPDSAASGSYAEQPKGLSFFFCGAAAAGLATFFFSGDWCCASISAGVCGGIAAVVLGSVLTRAGIKFSAIGLVFLSLGIGLAAGVVFRMNTKQAFEYAFGIPPPPSITSIEAERHYAGGPADYETMLIFHTDRATFESIIENRLFRPYEKVARDQNDLFLHLFGGSQAKASRVAQLAYGGGAPEVFQSPIGRVENVFVLYFPKSGLVVVRHSKS